MTSAPQSIHPIAESVRHSALPWFLSGVRFRMNGQDWQSINRYDEATKSDENIALVGYDSRSGLGRADALFIVEAVNSYESMKLRIAELENIISERAAP